MKNDIIPNSGSILREKRKLLGLTQKQVAEAAQIALPQYQKFETNTREIMTASFYITCLVLTALKIDITEFFILQNTMSKGI